MRNSGFSVALVMFCTRRNSGERPCVCSCGGSAPTEINEAKQHKRHTTPGHLPNTKTPDPRGCTGTTGYGNARILLLHLMTLALAVAGGIAPPAKLGIRCSLYSHTIHLQCRSRCKLLWLPLPLTNPREGGKPSLLSLAVVFSFRKPREIRRKFPRFCSS